MKFKDIEIHTKHDGDNIFFNVNDVGMALGYITKAKGKCYCHKQRINRILNSCCINTILFNNKERYLDLIGLKQFISVSHTEQKTEFLQFLRNNNLVKYDEVFSTTRKESIFLEGLSKVLQELGYSIVVQYIEGNYRFDAYIPELDIVIEYDENNHNHYNKIQEENRETYIKNNHQNVIRVNDFKDIYSNIGIVITKILKLKNN